ncbi:hypothetical protein ACB092_01G370700 [Castanea dentata]
MMCYCNKKPILVVAWIADNPGRRFYGCPNYWVGQKCRFFQWRDDEICERVKVLIPQQRQRIIQLEAKLAECKKREKVAVVGSAYNIFQHTTKLNPNIFIVIIKKSKSMFTK